MNEIFFTIWDWADLNPNRVVFFSAFIFTLLYYFMKFVAVIVGHLMSPFRKRDINIRLNVASTEQAQSVAQHTAQAVQRAIDNRSSEPLDNRRTRLEAISDD